MPRRRRHARRWTFDRFDWVLGPIDVRWPVLTEREREAKLEAMERAWHEQGPEFVEGWRSERPGERPWAWWAFDAREEEPSYTEDGPGAEVERLLELGELTEAEISAVLAAGDKEFEDQVAGRVGWPQAPASVYRANAVRRHLGMPELPTEGFGALHATRPRTGVTMDLEPFRGFGRG